MNYNRIRHLNTKGQRELMILKRKLAIFESRVSKLKGMRHLNDFRLSLRKFISNKINPFLKGFSKALDKASRVNHLSTTVSGFKLPATFKTFRYIPEALTGMIMRNHGQAFVGLFIRIITALGGVPSIMLVRSIKTFFSNTCQIANTQGVKGLVLYLKVCNVCLQQYICGHKGSSPMKPRVSLTLSGIPRVIPAWMRNFIRLGHNLHIRLTLSLISIYRDFLFRGSLKLNSITDKSSADANVEKMVISYIGNFQKLFITPHIPKAGWTKWLLGKFSYFPIPKASPASYKEVSSSPASLWRAAVALSTEQVEAIKVLTGPTCRGGTEDPVSIIKDIQESSFKGEWPGQSASDAKLHSLVPSGKLGIKQEAAGKVRVFAMIDPWSQWSLYPYHKGIFAILAKYPKIDGTFDQMRPLKRAWISSGKPGWGLYSMDLSSATDRLPISIQIPLIKTVFSLTEEGVQAWKALLVNRVYALPSSASSYMPSPPSGVKYATGQPMGGYSSWPMLALTHHLIVQCAAWESKICPLNRLFLDYAVLGDDIVIYNTKVAKQYHQIILGLGVECNLSKSILSPKGIGLEFAKRIILKGQDSSPAPLKEFHSAMMSPQTLAEYGRKYNLSPVQALKVAGFGYKALGSVNRSFSKITNLKIRYFIFIDIMTNPEVLKTALKATALGLSTEMMCKILKDYIITYIHPKTILYTYMLEDFATDSKDWFNLQILNMECPDMFSKICLMDWTFKYTNYLANRPPYVDKMRWLNNLITIPFGAKLYSLHDQGIKRFHELKLELRTHKEWGPDFNQSLIYLIQTIQKCIQIDKETTFMQVSQYYHLKSDIPKRPGFPNLYRIQESWKGFVAIARKSYPVASNVHVVVETKASGFLSGTLLLKVLSVGNGIRSLFLRRRSNTSNTNLFRRWLIHPWSKVAPFFGIRTVVSFIIGEALINFLVLLTSITLLYIVLIYLGIDKSTDLMSLWLMFLKSTVKLNGQLVNWISYIHCHLWEYKFHYHSPGTFGYFGLTLISWILWGVLSSLGGFNVITEAALNLSNGENIVMILILAHLNMMWLGVKYPLLIILSLLDQIPLIHLLINNLGMSVYLLDDVMAFILRPITLTNEISEFLAERVVLLNEDPHQEPLVFMGDPTPTETFVDPVWGDETDTPTERGNSPGPEIVIKPEITGFAYYKLWVSQFVINNPTLISFGFSMTTGIFGHILLTTSKSVLSIPMMTFF